MRRAKKMYSLLIFLLLVAPVGAQESADPLVRKLNDFLPTYTPFPPPEPPDRYFPDEVGKKVADAITDAYLQNAEAVEQRARELAQHDAALAAKGERVTGITPQVPALAGRVPEVNEKSDSDGAEPSAAPAELLAQSEAELQQQDYWGANFHYQLALMIDETSAKARAGLEKVEASLQNLDPAEEARPRDPLAKVRQAEWEHDKQTLKYLLPGSGFVKDNFIVAGTQVATEGLVGAATFGALTMVQTGAKLFHLLSGNPVP